MRAFIGIPFSVEVKQYLEGIKKEILDNSIKANPSRMENFHLTLLFLGEINEKEQIDIESALDSLEDIKPFDIVLGKPGTFNKGKESILWVGINEGFDDLKQLHKEVVRLVNDQGFDFPSNQYKPHITLARRVLFEDEFNIMKIKIKPIVVKVDKVHLYESHQINGVLTYTPRKTINL